MSSCDNSASESNHVVTATELIANNECNTNRQEGEAIDTTIVGNETFHLTKTNVESKLSAVENTPVTTKIVVTTDNATGTENAISSITVGNAMLPSQPAVVAAATITRDAAEGAQTKTVATTENDKATAKTLLVIKATAAAAATINQIGSTTAAAALVEICDRGQASRVAATIAATTDELSTAALSTTNPVDRTSATTAKMAPPSPTTPTTPMRSPTQDFPHIASEPTFGIALRRNQQQQQHIFRSCHDAKHKATGSTSSNDDIATTGCGIRAGSVSASASPSMVRKSSNPSLMPRRVSFPKSDNELVTGYLEPANPWENANVVKSISEIAELYVMSCQKHNTKPLQTILDHLKAVELNRALRQPLLSLKSIKLEHSDCEALEEILKRVQYRTVDLSSCDLTESAAMALFEMVEYYEAANELDISSNANGMTHRGWTSCTYMVSHSHALQVLNAQGNPISRTGAENLGHALCTSNIHTIKLEHCGLKGAPLSGLCFKLRHNRVLKELWLAHNDLNCEDAENIAKLLAVNHYLQLLDISNNNIRDVGLRKIVEALVTQSRELEKRSFLQRTTAIDDDDGSVIEKATDSADKGYEDDLSSGGEGDGCSLDSDASQSEDTDDEAFESERINKAINESCAVTAGAVVPAVVGTSSVTTDDVDADEEDTEETVKSTPSVTLKNSAPSAVAGGQSMLDKLLSMNSTESSSSDDVVSNISTDTLTACCSEDASLVSDDIFENSLAAAASVGKTNCNATTLTKVLPPLASTLTDSGNEMSSSIAVTTNFHTSERDINSEATEDTRTNSSCSTVETKGGSGVSAVLDTTTSSSSGNNNQNHQPHDVVTSLPASTCLFEVAAVDTGCLISTSATKALDVNKNTTKLIEDFDDTHSTDSAFESASEGDISRHLPEEFSRLSASFESSRLEEASLSKDFAGVETATIATESTECLVAAVAATDSPRTAMTIREMPHVKLPTHPTISSSLTNIPPPIAVVVDASLPANVSSEERGDGTSCGVGSLPLPALAAPKVTISENPLLFNKPKLTDSVSPRPTPPPPSTSPGGASLGLRRTESSCAIITSATRHRSQSSDSLCSDTSLDGSNSSDSNFPPSTQFSEKLAKNDTLTRQQRNTETSSDANNKAPCGLKALALWNNSLTKESGHHIADLLEETTSLELLNIGKNCLSNDFVATIKDSLMRNTTLTTLGLQSAHLSAKGIETLSSILTFGGNCTLQRIDIRDNKLEVDSLSTLAEALKSNTTVTQIDIDDEPKRLSVSNDAHLDYARVLENVRSMCSRNEKTQSQIQATEKTPAHGNAAGRRRGGYYLGSRKISLTCHTRPVVVDNPATDNATTSTAPSNSKLEPKRKTGARLRSPIPSPPTISPSSSPSRSRFKVFRVSEVSSFTSPLSSTPPATTATDCSVAISATSAANHPSLKVQSTSLPNVSSFSLMATVASSTQSIKRFSVSPRSRFHVSKIYEDPRVPLASRALPPITSSVSTPLIPMMSPGTVLPSSSPVLLTESSAETTTAVAITTTSPSVSVTVAEITVTKPNVESTKTTSANVNPASNTVITQNQTMLSPILSTSSTLSSSLSSSSSSSSTSPASIGSSSSSIMSASSSSPSTSSPTPICSSGSSSSSTDNVDSAPALSVDDAAARCPIAVFDENDITLTNSSASTVLFQAAATEQANDNSRGDCVEANLSGITTPQTQPASTRARKTSWLGNPTAVDKLLTLFHNPGTIFQRSSSPDSNSMPPTALAAPLEGATQPTVQKSLVPSRKCSPPSWSKLGNEMMRPVTSAMQQANTSEASVAASLASTASEQSISFLDAASKQIFDFSKQVFRQNLAFGNETNSAAAAPPGMVNVSPNVASGGANNGTGLPEQRDAAHIPSKVQLEIKENISPENTITEGTLQSLKKLCLVASGDSGSGSVSGVHSAGSGSAFEELASDDHTEEDTKEQQLLKSSSNTLLSTASTAGSSSLQHEDPQQSTTPQTT